MKNARSLASECYRVFSFGADAGKGQKMTNDYEALRRALGSISSEDNALGQLISVRLAVEPRLLESALEALALADFPINPQLTHQRLTLIEFPVYVTQLKQLENLLRGLDVRSQCAQHAGRNSFDTRSDTIDQSCDFWSSSSPH